MFSPEPLGDQLAEVLEHGAGKQTPAPIRALAGYGTEPGNDPLALAAVLRRRPNPVLTTDRLAMVHQPLLLVAGDNDTVAQPLEPLANALSTARVLTLPGVAHLDLPVDQRFQQAALSFLANG